MTLDPELIKQVGPLAAKGVFGTTAIEIYEGGYGHVAKSADGETDGKTTKETPFEKLVTIEISQGGGYTGAALYQSAATFASAATAGFRYVARGRSGPLVQGLPPWEQTGWSTS